MDPSELIKAAPVVAKGAAAIGAVVPFTAIVKRMLGPAADELAEMWRDQVRLYRYERQLKCVEKAERMAQEAGFTPQAVPPKILFPLLEGASFEDNEDLHTMWAALLANASAPDAGDLVRPSFCEILKIMTPDVARLLNSAFDYAELKAHPQPEPFRRKLTPQEEQGLQSPSIVENIIALTKVDVGTYRKLHQRFARDIFEIKAPTDITPEGKERAADLRDHRFAIAMDELGRIEMWSTTNQGAGDHY